MKQKNLFSLSETAKSAFFTKRDSGRLKLILRGKRFGFSLEEIRQLLDLYDMGDQQLTQLQRTYEVALERLSDMERQRAELDVAIEDLKKQLEWGRSEIARLETQSQ
jgi:DNA-binding transcriptional MerR regulator